MDSSDISDQILSALPHSREPGRVSEVQKIMKQKKKKKNTNQRCSDLCKSSESLWETPAHCSVLQSIKNSCQGCSEPQGGSSIIYSLGFAHSQQRSWFSCLNFPVWISISGCDKVIYVTVQRTDQRKGWRHQSKKEEVSSTGSCWVFLEGDMQLGLCKFKPGRTPTISN